MIRHVALVTGGMGGIGTEICKQLASNDRIIVLANCLPGYPQIHEWIGERLTEGFNNIQPVEADVSDFKSTEKMINEIQSRFGTIDILVNAAGITRDNQLKKMSEDDWLAVINTNLNSAFNVTRLVIERMITNEWGRIINISSVNGSKGQFGQTNYSAAKAGLYGFTKALAQEVVKKGITVNTISPGYVETPMVKAIRPDVLDKIISTIPMGRLAQPGEIASLVSFLALGDSAYITGADIPINGGMYMS